MNEFLEAAWALRWVFAMILVISGVARLAMWWMERGDE